MAVIIPFGAQSGMTAYSKDTDVSIGKLFSGGNAVFLFSQSKVKKTSVTKTDFAKCVAWIVVGVDSTGMVKTDGNLYPLESANVSYQEDIQIIWNAVSPGTMPAGITAGMSSGVEALIPATAADCVILLGYNANYSIAVKGPDDAFSTYDPKKFFNSLTTLGNLTSATLPDSPSWNTGKQRTMARTDWNVFTRTGKGYYVGGNSTIATAAQEIDATFIRGTGSLTNGNNVYFQLNYSANARGDFSKTATKFEILKDATS